jgi:hypothetical protein
MDHRFLPSVACYLRCFHGRRPLVQQWQIIWTLRFLLGVLKIAMTGL